MANTEYKKYCNRILKQYGKYLKHGASSEYKRFSRGEGNFGGNR